MAMQCGSQHPSQAAHSSLLYSEGWTTEWDSGILVLSRGSHSTAPRQPETATCFLRLGFRVCHQAGRPELLPPTPLSLLSALDPLIEILAPQAGPWPQSVLGTLLLLTALMHCHFCSKQWPLLCLCLSSNQPRSFRPPSSPLPSLLQVLSPWSPSWPVSSGSACSTLALSAF